MVTFFYSLSFRISILKLNDFSMKTNVTSFKKSLDSQAVNSMFYVILKLVPCTKLVKNIQLQRKCFAWVAYLKHVIEKIKIIISTFFWCHDISHVLF